MRQFLIGLIEAAISICIVLGMAWMLIISASAIARWEKANDYPYGRMCDPNVFNLYTSTCPTK